MSKARATTDLERIIRDTVREVNIPSTVEVNVQTDEEIRDIILDEFKIRRVLDNLVKNAVEAMRAGGNLRVTAHREEEKIVVKVVDNGVGIPP